MNLVLQCAVCGTNHPVGTAACATCRATGVANLRLMFECPACYRLGLNPTCDVCAPAPLLPYEVVEDPTGTDEFLPYEVVEAEDDGGGDPDSEFELTLDGDDEDADLDDDIDFTIDLE